MFDLWPRSGVVLWLVLCQLDTLSAETFRHITAEPAAGAKIKDAGNLKEGNISGLPFLGANPGVFEAFRPARPDYSFW